MCQVRELAYVPHHSCHYDKHSFTRNNRIELVKESELQEEQQKHSVICD